MTTKTDFCKSLPWTREILWTGLTGFTKIDEDRLAKIELADRSVRGEYNGFRVTILNKREGKVDETFFAFDDYLAKDLNKRLDDRRDYPLQDNPCFKVVAHCGWHWYIAKPRSAKPFTEAVEGYIQMFA